jgi:hypothetical protein
MSDTDFGNNIDEQDALLQEYYIEELPRLMYEDNAFWGLVAKKEDASGREVVNAVNYGAGQARSADFSVAQDMSELEGELVVNFKVPFAKNRQVAKVSTDLAYQTEGAASFVDAVTLISDNNAESMVNDVARSIYRSKSGAIGRLASWSGNVGTLADANDAVNLEIGMQLDLAAAETTAGVRAYGSNGHGLYVKGVDVDQGLFYTGELPTPDAADTDFDDTQDGLVSPGQTDYIFCRGDRNAKYVGVADWIPITVASNDSFCNVNRFVHRQRLAGVVHDARSASTLMDALEDGLAKVARIGGKTTHVFVSHIRHAQLSKELGKRAVMTELTSTDAKFGYPAIKVVGPKGAAMVVADLYCQNDTAWALDLPTWQLFSRRKMVHAWNLDGRIWQRSPTADGMEIRFRSHGNLRCQKPRNNCRIRLA